MSNGYVVLSNEWLAMAEKIYPPAFLDFIHELQAKATETGDMIGVEDFDFRIMFDIVRMTACMNAIDHDALFVVVDDGDERTIKLVDGQRDNYERIMARNLERALPDLAEDDIFARWLETEPVGGNA